MIACLWFATGWAFAAAAGALLFAAPGLALVGWGHVLVPPFVHALTLGTILSGHYAAQAVRWRETAAAAGPRHRAADALDWAVWAFHAAGTAVLLWGLGRGLPSGSSVAATWGGHYLIPTAIVLSLGGEVWRHLRERRGGGRSGGAPGMVPLSGLMRHLPGLGLLVAMPLGVLLLMDRATGQFGFYGPPQIALHALAAAFLFVLPAQVLAQSREPAPVAPGGAVPSAGPGPRPVLLAALALFAVALDARAFGAGFSGGMPLGLALLAAVALWQGIPAPPRLGWAHEQALRRLPWALFGLMLLHLALRAWRGLGEAEALAPAAMAAAWFLLGVAGPDWLLRLSVSVAGASAPGPRARRAVLFTQWAGALAVLAGQAAEAVLPVRAGAGLWLLGALGMVTLALGGRFRGRVGVSFRA